MKRLTGLGILGVFLVTACAPRLQEVQVPPERIFQSGYSLVPLNEKGWFIAGRNPYQLGIAKSGEGPDETLAIQAGLVKLSAFTTSEEFVRLVKETHIKNTDPRRLKIIKHDVAAYPEKGPYCAMTHGVMEDYAAVKRSRLTGYMLLEMMELTCLDPKGTGVSVAYSHRYYPGQKDDRFLEKASSVLTSVEFGDLGKLDSD